MDERRKLIELIRNAYVAIPPHVYKAAVDDTAAVVIADILIANGATFAKDKHVPTKWIPVTERLPELGENVLMYFKDDETVVSGFLNGGEPGRATWWSSFTDGDWYTDCDSSPDYWMPAPEPPTDMRKGENG